ncbi:fluoroquinolone transporter permease [Saccharopolyspora sp. K220]|uniref:fluoroquinolone export ABC transporter permease subunit n=1 Tax=Saccharopolyspora soli TaxID=2926618 RepID=UPI001F5A27E9|nr:fluoroquinolone transporter permease [Saccharopolyspora soli]MCI2422392.1 fluoroquinolone transporter permease [Saccharopolyspora soli]
MTRLRVALRLELLTQVRYKFLHAAVFSGLLWIAVLLPIPSEARVVLEPYIVFGDLAIVGFFFIAASVFFEKDERTLSAIAITPLRFSEYLGAKLLTLTGLTVVLAVGVATATRGLAYDLPVLVLGAALGAIPMLLAGFLSSLPFHSVSDWFMLGMLPLALLTAPVFHFAGLWESSLLYLIPTQGPLLLIGAAFEQKSLSGWEFGYAIGYPLLVLAVLWNAAERMFVRYALAGKGSAA